MADTNILDKLFSTSVEEIETFTDLVDKVAAQKITENEMLRLKKTSNYLVETQKLITITHGQHDNNYVWHIVPAHEKRPWRAPIKEVLYTIGVIINKYLPRDVMFDLHRPSENYGIKEITVRANGILDHWSVQDADLQKVTGRFFEALNTLV